MDDIYQDNIIENAKAIKNKHAIHDGLCGVGKNPNCGDSAKFYIKLDNKSNVVDASFEGDGCAISMASCNMLIEFIKNKNLAELKMIMPGDIYGLLGIHISPARVSCALLSYNALEDILKKL
jgi:nitrogen fixation NifU-like protein